MEQLIDPTILNSLDDANPTISDATARYFGYLSLANRATQESSIVDSAAETLKLLGFHERQTTLFVNRTVPPTIYHESDLDAQTDVCLVHTRTTFVLLVLVTDNGPLYVL